MHPIFVACEYVLVTYFSLELILRVVNDRVGFVRNECCHWNLFDAAVLGLALLQLAVLSIVG